MGREAAQEPEQEKHDQHQAERAAEPCSAIGAIAVVTAAAAQKDDDQDDDEQQ